MMIEKRIALSSYEIDEASNVIINKIIHLDSFIRAKTIFSYYPIKNEVNILPMIKKHIKDKNICIPKIEKNEGIMTARIVEDLDDLKYDKYNIPTPSDTSRIINPYEIEFVIVPIVAFDKENNRIGYGGGYYDRFLKECINAKKCGVAYSFQETDIILSRAYDIKMDIVVTEI